MQISLVGQQLHLYATAAAFNAVARAIRKGRSGITQTLSLEAGQSTFSTLLLNCSGLSCRARVVGDQVHLDYAERDKNRLYPCFSMPAQTPAAALFFIDKTQQEPPLLSDDSLNLVLHINENSA